MCLDIGDKRIGIAVSDPFCEYALPVETYFRKNLKTDLQKIIEYYKEKCANYMVCGLPVNFDGTPSIQTQKAEFFIAKLEEELKIKIIRVDERCSTCEAEDTLISQGYGRKERKQYVDSLAATTILNGYLLELKQKNNTFKKENIMCEDKNCTCGCQEGKECTCGCQEEQECTCNDCVDIDEDIVELTADDGRKLKFYFVGTIEFKGKNYSAFEPAEEIEGMTEEDIVIFEVAETEGEEAELLPVEDEALLEEVFQEFCRVLEEDELAEQAEQLENK